MCVWPFGVSIPLKFLHSFGPFGRPLVYFWITFSHLQGLFDIWENFILKRSMYRAKNIVTMIILAFCWLLNWIKEETKNYVLTSKIQSRLKCHKYPAFSLSGENLLFVCRIHNDLHAVLITKLEKSSSFNFASDKQRCWLSSSIDQFLLR